MDLLPLLLLLLNLLSVSAVWHTEVFCEDGEREGSVVYHVGDGWFYHLNRGDEEKQYYVCVFQRTNGCTGRAIFHAGRGFRHSQEHTGHNADILRSEVMALKRNILQRCRSLDYTPFSTIVEQEKRRFCAEVAAQVTLASFRTSMLNARQSNYPAIPDSLQSLTDLLTNPQYEVLTTTHDGLDNVYAGSVTDSNGDHHVLLASRRMLTIMSRMSTLFSDGTFQVVPSLPTLANRRAQVFNIMTSWRGHTILLATAIMECRTEVAYEAVLTLLRNVLQRWRFTRIITDNEAAETNSWATVFEPDTMQSCFWHTCRAFVTELSVLHLARWFRDPNVPQFRVIVRMACALPLLPPALLRLGWRVVRREARLLGGNWLLNLMTPFFEYLWLNWVNNDRRRRMMSVYGSEHRTNNICESLNSRMLELLGRHPNIFHFLAVYVQMENTAYTDFMTLFNGLQASRARKTQAIVNDRIIQLLSRELRRPPMGINDAVRRFLLEVSQRVRAIVEDHIRNLQ